MVARGNRVAGFKADHQRCLLADRPATRRVGIDIATAVAQIACTSLPFPQGPSRKKPRASQTSLPVSVKPEARVLSRMARRLLTIIFRHHEPNHVGVARHTGWLNWRKPAIRSAIEVLPRAPMAPGRRGERRTLEPRTGPLEG